ncbi:Por secretion system C-terminal sorting domain-containing protein [Belliella buryatensis]|uniref:Por secretion system C-terminal sorting domain-containing protein n=1 Tax=Belliella buryatensis TaxID=1500549 RepID=A0A239DPZ5_9BACT|nr:T9SS type A sorting domain-containing protein [Belliella buryatensis]SNS34407.1 Por secretion system C-terminal sorting domain-containing protein [Belliella buryatensis]
MDFLKRKYGTQLTLNSARIYRIILFIFLEMGYSYVSFSQIALEIGDYRTISSGDFDNPAIWERWDGLAWLPAATKPEIGNNVFFQQGNEIRIRANESVNNLYLFSAASPGRLLNLQTFELRVNGALRAFRLELGQFTINNVSNATTDWIYPQTGSIVFIGNSRNVVDRSSWSANTLNSRFQVRFRANPGQSLTVNSGFKANAFIIESGTVVQTLNTDGIPACSTFSYNVQAMFNGTGPYGDFIIEPGATFISQCPGPPQEQIIRRTNTIPAALFHLKPGANLVLLGNNPQMDVAEFRFEGNTYYRSNAGTQRLISTTFASSGNPKTYHNLFFENTAVKLLPDSVFLTGDIGRLTGPAPSDGPTLLRFQGMGEQQIVNWELDLSQIHVNKPSGRIVTFNDLRSLGNWIMESGQIDFNGYDLYVNTDGAGVFRYLGGTWRNIHRLFYNNFPSILTNENAHFPFEDIYQGGVRRLRLSGTSPGGDFQVRYIEIPGSNWEPDFDDTDGTPILYQLNSYFEIEGLSAGSDPIEMELAAENLIVDAVDDLRIVSNGIPAPGLHLPGVDADTLWARRNLTYDELNNQTFTIGSYRYLSILPINFINHKAIWKSGEVNISWKIAASEEQGVFEIEKAIDQVEHFKSVAKLPSEKDILVHHFLYSWEKPKGRIFFRIKFTNLEGKSVYSRVFRLEGLNEFSPKASIYPNPVKTEQLHLTLPNYFDPASSTIQIYDSNGILINICGYEDFNNNFNGDSLQTGMYLIHAYDGKHLEVLKLIKN